MNFPQNLIKRQEYIEQMNAIKPATSSHKMRQALSLYVLRFISAAPLPLPVSEESSCPSGVPRPR